MPDDYDAQPVNDVSRSLGRIEQKLDEALDTQDELENIIAGVSDRVTALERAKTYVQGSMAVITAILVWLSSHIPQLPFLK